MSVESFGSTGKQCPLFGRWEISAIELRNGRLRLSYSAAPILQTLSAKSIAASPLPLYEKAGQPPFPFDWQEILWPRAPARRFCPDIGIVNLMLLEIANICASKYQRYLPFKEQVAAQIEGLCLELERHEVRSDE